MRPDRLPLTYDECRARFRRVASELRLPVWSHTIDPPGPSGQRLAIDAVRIGAARPRRALTVLSGVHGVEGFLGSALQCRLVQTVVGRAASGTLPDDVAVVVVHAVNPWGMAWWRRQNESNVDLNRNWRRDTLEPAHNEAYDELHPYACPDTAELPSVEALVVDALRLVDERGLAWVRDGITRGQYRHADGLHYGGERTEASNRFLEEVVTEHVGGVELALTLDLHTGHGPRGAVTLLSDQPPGSDQDGFLREHFGPDRVEATVDNPDATTGPKSGQIANGFRQLLGGAVAHATSVEFGTSADEEQLAATYLESWVHRHGDREDPVHADVVWAYRCCFTPDDPVWEATCLAAGADVLDRAVDAVAGWAG
ncbi:MAG: M14 family metallopeptidase [Acidimicrobiales bacterium]|nr:M14 family metallopeptidase [Acidimicrobiales bacterium]